MGPAPAWMFHAFLQLLNLIGVRLELNHLLLKVGFLPLGFGFT